MSTERSERPNIEGLSNNVHEQYQRFYPMAAHNELVAAIEAAEPIDRNIAARLVGRNWAREGSDYLLHRERTGMFVVTCSVVVTFLRFYGFSQYELAVKLFGDGDYPTAEVGWRALLELRAEQPLPEPSPPAPEPIPGLVPKQRPLPAYEEIKVSSGAAKALFVDKAIAHGRVFEQINAGAIYEPGEYVSSPQPDALIVVGSEVIGLALCKDLNTGKTVLRAVPAYTKEQQRLLASGKPGISLQEQKAARFLREMGWTVLPPKEK